MEDTLEYEDSEMIFTGKILPVTARLGAPILASYFFLIFYFVVDTYFISLIDHTSTSLLSGTALIFPVIYLYYAAGIGMCTGMASLISRGIGEKNTRVIDSAADSGLFLVICFCLVTISFGYVFSNEIIHTLAGSELSEEAVNLGKSYFLYLLPGLGVILLLHLFFGIFQGEGLMNHIGIASVLAGILNMVLDPVLIFGCNMGVSGAALATGISYFIACMYSFYVFITRKSSVPVRFRLIKVKRSTLYEIIRIGVPESMSMLSLALIFIVLNNLVSSIGESAMNSWAICARLDTFVVIPAYAISAATLTMAGQNYGRKNMERVSSIYHFNMMAGIVCVFLFAVFYSAVAPVLFTFFSTVEEVVAGAVRQVRFISFSFVGVSAVVISAAVFQATGRPIPALSIRLMRLVLLIFPAAYILARVFNWGMTGIFAGIVFGNTLILFISWAWTGGYINYLIEKNR